MAGTTKLMTAGGGGVNLTPASSIASDVTVNVPSVNGTAVVTSSAVSAAGQIPFSTDGSTFTPTAKIVSGTAQASTSGTSIDFTGIPSWVKRITVMFSGVSTSGTSVMQIQIGTSGGIQTSSYVSSNGQVTAAAAAAINTTTGFGLGTNATATDLSSGSVILTLLDSSNGTWSAFGATGAGNNTQIRFTGGAKVLSGTLDRVRITTVNGTDTFDAGTINILYE